MNTYSLKKTYKKLLIESMVDKSTFLIKVLDYLDKNVKEKSSMLNLVLESAVKELDLASIIASGDKKLRKKAEAVIHKKLSLIKGLDDSPFSFKDISPLYSNIINYMESGKEISISDAMIASDYYMKKMYNKADKEEKSLIAKGKMSIEKIIEKTGYYKKVSEKVKSIRSIENKVIKVYEDSNTKIVYPTSSYAFNQWINSNNYTVPWCTQNPSTWLSYTSSQLVMIGVDKLNREIISLKVNYDGTIDYQGTCDYRNNHMNRNSVWSVIGSSGDRKVFEKVNDDPELKDISQSVDFTLDDFLSYIKKFIEFNEYDLIKELIEKSFQYADADVCELFISNILDYADSNNKKENVVNVITNVFPDLYFNDPNIELDWENCLNKSSSNVYFCRKVFELAQNKRSHVKYFMMIAKFLKKFEKYIDVSSGFKDLFLLAIDKNNVLNFERILALCINKKSDAMELLPDASEFAEMFETKGLISFIKQKKGNITKWSTSSSTKQYQIYLNELFANNKEKTETLLEDKSLAEVDILLINQNYWRLNSKSRFYNLNFSTFKKDFVSLTNDDVNVIQQKIYSDIDTVMLFNTGDKKENMVLSTLLREFIDAYEKGNDTIIDVKNEKTFEIFKYLVKNARSVSTPYKKLSEIFRKNGYDISSISGLIAETFTNLNYESFYGLNKIENQETLDKYITELRESLDQRSLKSFSKFIVDTISYLKDRDIMLVDSLTLEDKFAISLINTPILKKLLTNKDSVNDQKSENTFDPYIYFYLLKDNKDLNVEIESLEIFLSSLEASRNSLVLVAKFLAESISSNAASSLFSSRSLINGIIDNSFKYLTLSMLILHEANKKDVCLDKKSLSNIISNSSFLNVNKNLRQLIYENFINISSNYGRNRLDSSERIVVRNCLSSGIRKSQKHLSSDSDVILSFCNNLDKHSKFQMRLVFPQKGLLTQEEEIVEENLVRQYVRLLLTWFI